MAKPTYCGNCKREANRETRGSAVATVPKGWYMVTVGTGFEGSHNGKAYRYLGLFCSIACLEDMIPEWAQVESRHRTP